MMRAPYPETARRQWVQIGGGAAAPVLCYLHPSQAVLLTSAAIVLGIVILGRVARGRLHRPHELRQSYPAGLVPYFASVLLLLLLLPSRPDIVAGSWGIMAAGNGVATLVGSRAGASTWPGDLARSTAASAALLLAGAAAGALLTWWCRDAITPPPHMWFSLGAPVLAAAAAAAVDTVQIRLDRNVSVPATAAAVMWTLSLVDANLAAAAAAALPHALALALPTNAVVAAAGYAAGTVSVSGGVVGMAIGTIVHVCAGWPGWLLLMAAFGLAVVTSRLGLQRKKVRGIEQEHEGRRGAGNAIANTGVAAGAALVAAVSYGETAALIAFAAALTAGASDTAASEIGKAWGGRTWALFPPARAVPGTPGAVSAVGTIAGLAAAAALGFLSVALGLVPPAAAGAVVVGATAGSVVESLLGGTLEPREVLNNDALNLINTATAAAVAVAVSRATA